jgi:hypothetical protein
MLAVAPCWDEPTQYSFKWINSLLNQLNVEYTPLFKDDATRENFEREAEKHDLIVFYNHGSSSGLYAQKGTSYVIDKNNDHLLKDKVIFTLACLWCSDGGIDAWRKGAKVVWGYTSEFGFTLTDEDLFEGCANIGLILVVKEGKTWDEALKLAKQKFNEAIGKAKDPWSVIWLRHDRDALVCYTESSPPQTSKCLLRRTLIKLLGPEKAWKITTKKLIGVMAFSIGYGIALHDFAHQTFELKGTVLSLEGGYIGFSLIMLGFLMLLLRSLNHTQKMAG